MTVRDVAGPAPSSELDDHWRRAWGAALHAVELDVDSAEDLLQRLHREEDLPDGFVVGDWIAPNLLGPVPAEFVDRARILLKRHLDVSDRLAHALAQVRAQRRGMAKFDRAEPPPIFVDKAL